MLQGGSEPAARDVVAQACRAMQQAIRSAGGEHYLRPLLTSHLLQGELVAALALIKERKEAQLSASTSGGPAAAPCPSVASGNTKALHEG